MIDQQTTPADPNDPLAFYWRKEVRELVAVENTLIPAGQAERHTILSLLAMALIADAWNGNKRGAVGNYPWREEQQIEPGRYRGDRYGDRYLGHNIACLAVDARGEIIDFEFNHNELYNSSAEHAEARLVRRIFNLNQNYDHWQTAEPGQLPDVPYATLLSGVTIYTTLESCAQCSGIMALGNVKSVVFLQSDPGQYRIGNILYNLSNPRAVSHPSSVTAGAANVSPPTKYGAPEPINAELFGFGPKLDLDAAYRDYMAGVQSDPSKFFFQAAPGQAPDKSTSITSFLCCDPARDIYAAAAAHLGGMKLSCPDFVPPGGPFGGQPGMTNADVLNQANRFREYVRVVGRRGTPHR
jgi:tRNA(Arg) A34 adenosine deaminase TadA